MRGAHKTDLAIEAGAAVGAALCGRQCGAAGPLVGGERDARGHLDAGFEPAAGAGGLETQRGHAGRGLCRGGDHRQPDVFHSDPYSLEAFPYAPWHTALIPVLAVFVLTTIATRLGREEKVRLGTAERRQGRSARRWRPTWAWPRWPVTVWRSRGWPATVGSRMVPRRCCWPRTSGAG
jgi:hypothetical protein